MRVFIGLKAYLALNETQDAVFECLVTFVSANDVTPLYCLKPLSNETKRKPSKLAKPTKHAKLLNAARQASMQSGVPDLVSAK